MLPSLNYNHIKGTIGQFYETWSLALLEHNEQKIWIIFKDLIIQIFWSMIPGEPLIKFIKIDTCSSFKGGVSPKFKFMQSISQQHIWKLNDSKRTGHFHRTHKYSYIYGLWLYRASQVVMNVRINIDKKGNSFRQEHENR